MSPLYRARRWRRRRSSHGKRVFPKDKMKPVFDTKRSIISKVAFVLLNASGWYKTNDSFVEPMKFGHRLTSSNIQIQSFIVGNPRTDWPEPYQCKWDGEYGGSNAIMTNAILI